MRLWYSDTLQPSLKPRHCTFLFPPKSDRAQGLYLLNAPLGVVTPQVRLCGAINRASSQTDTGCEWHFHFRGTGRCLWDRSFVTEASHIGILMTSCNLLKKFNKSYQTKRGKAAFQLIIKHLTAVLVSEGTHKLQTFLFPKWLTFNQSRMIILFLWWGICAMLTLDESVYAPALAVLSGDWDQSSGNLNIIGGPVMPFKVLNGFMIRLIGTRSNIKNAVIAQNY